MRKYIWLILTVAIISLVGIAWSQPAPRGIPRIFSGLTAKTTLTGADLFVINDSADGYKPKKITDTNLLTALGSTFAPVPAETSIASSATPTPAVGTAGAEIRYIITALAEAPTFGAPTGTPVNGQLLWFRIKDDGTARALTWNAAYAAVASLPLPTTTIISTTMYVAFRWNSTDSKWDLVGVR